MAATLLTLRDVLVNYGNLAALQIAALDLLPREVLAIIGPNGGGKSTLLRVMGLLQRPTSGTVLFRGEHAFDGNSLNSGGASPRCFRNRCWSTRQSTKTPPSV